MRYRSQLAARAFSRRSSLALLLLAPLVGCWLQPAESAKGAAAPFEVLALSPGVEEGPRVALVIGNQFYVGERQLRTPRQDAVDVAAALRLLGYQVRELHDLGTKDEMEAVVRDFGASVKNGAALFYFAGHGLQVNGANYLIPTGARLRTLDDVRKQGFAMESVYAAMRDAETRQNVIIIDACRDNQFAPTEPTTGWVAGLAPPPNNAPGESLIAYSTAINTQSPDDPVGGHSRYTRGLLKFIKQPGLKIEDFFKLVQSYVSENSEGYQRPWITSSFGARNREAYFKAPVFMMGNIHRGDDEVSVIVNGVLHMLWTNDGNKPRPIPLKSGPNTLEIKVYNARTLRGWPGSRPEGWSYHACFSNSAGQQLRCFEDGEDLPQRGGPRHGKTFRVASATIVFDENTDTITFTEVKERLWAATARASATDRGDLLTFAAPGAEAPGR